MKKNCALSILLVCILLTYNLELVNAKRYTSGSRKTPSGGRTQSSNTHVTKPTYSTSSGNSHSDLSKLSYANTNSQPNRPAASGGQNPAPIGWNVPQKQGPPPAYSAQNPAGGAKTNMHEAPPAYGSNVHTPIQATNTHGLQSGYPMQQGTYHAPGSLPAGATYHSPGSLPAGATYYPGGHAPAGGSYYPSGGMPAGATYHAPGAIPAGATYYPAGHPPAGASYYPAAGGLPAGGSYLPAGSALPAGATYYSQPPQSSGLGFGSGLAAGAIGGAILGHVLTPSQTRVVEHAPAASSNSGGEDRIIIINNGAPVTATDAGNGTTVLNTAQAAPPQAAVPADQTPVVPGQAAPNVPLAPMGENVANNMNTNSAVNPEQMAQQPPVQQPGEQPPAPGGIICVPVRVNETDPADSTIVKEVEKIACYPAPPPEPAMNGNATAPQPVPNAPVNGNEGSAQLAPMNAPGQLPSTGPTQATLMAEQSQVHTSGVATIQFCSLLSALMVIVTVSRY